MSVTVTQAALLVNCPVCGRERGQRCRNLLQPWRQAQHPHDRRGELAQIKYGPVGRTPSARYAAGVRWIASEDEPTIMDFTEMEGFISVQLLAAVFDKDPADVADDVCRYRAEHDS